MPRCNISELNTVRKQLSRIKGGGLLRACRAAQIYSLIISDVPGDPLDIIASGPTVLDTSTPEQALAILDRFRSRAPAFRRRSLPGWKAGARCRAHRPRAGRRTW